MSANDHRLLEKLKRLALNFGLLKIILIVSFGFFGYVLYVNPYFLADLEQNYSDHLRHEWVAWLFLHVGFRVFDTPIGILGAQVTSLNPHPYWDMHPTIYPLGNILYFIPFGELSNLGIIKDIVVHKLMILSFLIGAHVAVYYFVKELQRIGYDFDSFLMILMVPFFYLHMVFWSLNGIYDVIAVLLIILSIKYHKEGASLKSLVLLTGAFFFHYRSLFYFPLWVLVFVNFVSRYKEHLRSVVTHFNAFTLACIWFLAVALLDVYTVLLSFVGRTWETPANWHPSIMSITSGRVDAQMLLFTVSAIILVLLVKRKAYVTVSTIVLSLAYLFLIPQWALWHHLFFFPILLLPSNKRSIELSAFWGLIIIIFTTGVISPLYFLELVQNILH